MRTQEGTCQLQLFPVFLFSTFSFVMKVRFPGAAFWKLRWAGPICVFCLFVCLLACFFAVVSDWPGILITIAEREGQEVGACSQLSQKQVLLAAGVWYQLLTGDMDQASHVVGGVCHIVVLSVFCCATPNKQQGPFKTNKTNTLIPTALPAARNFSLCCCNLGWPEGTFQRVAPFKGAVVRLDT